ncbi:OmpA/MotB family protein [Sedimenticola hydrogenitrophicus]|uniref:OmpA/MotB family protein n=1 Tax=Sedimenticola hydrogenitrophicus TaxID=2967975 RepID=UPI0021A8396A|nr:OmpA family protein [Sedimenticola hydrogenitrophicus]
MERRRPHLPPPPRWEDEPLPDDSDDGWLIIYLDVMTLMLCLFVVLLAYSSYSVEEYEALARELSSSAPVTAPLPESEPKPMRESGPVAEPAPLRRDSAESRQSLAEREAQRLRQEFQGALRGQGLQESVEVTVVANRVNLQISERILFGSGRAELTGEGRDVLVKLVPLLAAAGDHALSIEGHTDPTPIATPRFPSNWELSAQRATGVLRFLLSQGIAAERMRAVGHADTRPLADNSSPEGRARNRRVVLILQREEE